MSKILKQYTAKQVKEGGGVIVNRVFGYGQTSHFDPFLMLDYFETKSNKPSSGFPWHPHKGIETITYMLKGSIEHEDSLGNKDIVGPGELQWMTAGRGIMHQEIPKPSPNGYQGFQFWVNLKSTEKLIPPTYRDIKDGQMKSYEKDGVKVNVIAGDYNGIKGPIDKSNLGISMLHFTLQTNTQITINREDGKQGFLFVFKGNGLSNSESLETYNVYTLSNGNFDIKSTEDMEFIYCEGTPLKEPIAWYGPIVMNTKKELEETFNDINNGKFITKQ